MTSAKRIYLAVAGGLVALGIVLAGIGFIASGFDPAVFNTRSTCATTGRSPSRRRGGRPDGAASHRAAQPDRRGRCLRLVEPLVAPEAPWRPRTRSIRRVLTAHRPVLRPPCRVKRSTRTPIKQPESTPTCSPLRAGAP